MPSNMAANTNHTTLLENQSTIEYLSLMLILANFGCKIIFMCSVNFWHQEDSIRKHWLCDLLSSSGLLSEVSCLQMKTSHYSRILSPSFILT